MTEVLCFGFFSRSLVQNGRNTLWLLSWHFSVVNWSKLINCNDYENISRQIETSMHSSRQNRSHQVSESNEPDCCYMWMGGVVAVSVWNMTMYIALSDNHIIALFLLCSWCIGTLQICFLRNIALIFKQILYNFHSTF